MALREPKRDQKRLKLPYWSHKSAQRAYFGLEGAERGWNTKEDIQTDQFGPFEGLNMRRARSTSWKGDPSVRGKMKKVKVLKQTNKFTTFEFKLQRQLNLKGEAVKNSNVFSDQA